MIYSNNYYNLIWIICTDYHYNWLVGWLLPGSLKLDLLIISNYHNYFIIDKTIVSN